MNSETGLVSGREYTSVRPRGYAPWSPNKKTRVLLDQITTTLDDLQPYWPVTARQLFYRLVGTVGYPKSEKAYKVLLEKLNRGRRSGRIPWDAIRDDGATDEVPPVGWDTLGVNYWANPDTLLENLMEEFPGEYAMNYDQLRTAGQTHHVEVWVEAAGMVPQIVSAVSGLYIPVRSSGGFESVTTKHALGQAFNGLDVAILFIGDYDASGLARMDSAAADIQAFSTGRIEVEHVAVTEDQIEDFHLETAPGKSTDMRAGGMDETVQVEAIDPADLARITRAAAVGWVDELLIERINDEVLTARTAIEEFAESEIRERWSDDD